MWGTVTLFQSLIRGYSGLLACRFFLGLCEGDLFPGFVLYLSEFYCRQELQRRIDCTYGAASVSGAFSGLLAAATAKMDGIAALKGWARIFLLEGAATVWFSLFALWALPNTPKHVRLFNHEEASYCSQRLSADAKVNENPHISFKAVLSVFKELHVVNMAAITFCNGIVIAGIAYFTPSIVQALGYGDTKTQLLTVPPYTIAFLLTMAAENSADRY